MEVIACRDVNFAYPGCDQQALTDIDFAIERTEFVLLCGKSGCGKSTLLRHLKKNLMPYGNLRGNILYCGQEVEELDNRVSAAEIGFVQQNPDNQIVTDKVWHELAFGLESLGLDNRTIKQRVAEMASFFGIQTWFRKNVSELSGGQKQLLNLASIMAMQPKLLILDEPTSQLDPIAAADFIATLKKLNTELGTTILISEHRLEELYPLADRVLVMEQGRLVLNGSPREVAARMAEGVCGDMFCGLPAVVKIAGTVGCGENSPLTVREGRLWLEQRLGEPELGQTSSEELAQKPSGSLREKLFPKSKPEEEQPALAMHDVWFRYGSALPDTLRGVELAVRRGELFAILGGNGVGKSTTLKALVRLIKPYRGVIEIGGRRLDGLSDKELFSQGLAMLPQNPQALFTEITVREELLEALADCKLPEDEQTSRMTAMAAEMELTPLLETHPYDLSGGEQQRLALGKILLRQPRILLLDEPTKGLDPFFKQTLAAIFARLCGQGLTILMVSHDIEFCAEYADRCALFFDGEVVSCGTPREFFAGNSFYTTTANRLAAQWFPEAVTWEEVAAQCAEAMTSAR